MATSKIQGAIAAGHPKTAEAGMEMFHLGGNVFDAVSAAALAAFVTEPCLTSPGGGGFLLAHTQSNQNILFDFFTQTPFRKKDAKSADFYPIQVNFGAATQEFHIGLGSIAVPGTVKGILQVHQTLGRLPLHVIAEPAIHYAKTGIEVNDFQAYCFKILSPILLATPETRKIYAPDGFLLQPGEQLVATDLANTLAQIVEEGADAVYRGEIAQRLVQDCREAGGHLTLEDLQQYQVIERQPLETCYRGRTLITNPPPSSGGSLIAFTLALLSTVNLNDIAFGSLAHLQLLAHAMRLTNSARADGYDANLYEPDIAARFLSSPYVDSCVEQLHDQLPNLRSPGGNKWGSTTHISAIDSDGNAASMTTSNGEGSSYVIPGTGIMMNNMLGEADLHPGGFHQWQENRRISSMMAPTMVLQHNQPEIVLGSGGSNRIRTAILQVISNIIDFHMSIDEAVHAPRLHWEAEVLSLEPGFDFPTDKNQFPFTEAVKLWEAPNMFFGGVHAVENRGGTLSGQGDRRRGGASLIS